MHVRCWLLLILAFWVPSTSLAQAVRARLDRDSIYLGETVLLTIEVDGRQGGGDSPDVGQLTHDFTVLDSAANTQIQLISGHYVSTAQWTFELEPKRSGTLVLPALAIGAQLRTPPLTLTVLPPDPAAQQSSNDVFIEAQAEPLTPYVQEQVRYSERLFYAVPLREGGLNRAAPPPELLLQKLGDDITYAAERNGRRYRVVERNYAVFAQSSGALEIPRLRFRGRTTPPNASRTPRDRLLTRGQAIEVVSDPIVLNVKPRPANFHGEPWLPSAALSLHESWSQDPPQFRIGEPVTRTLILEAQGLDAAQLPALTVPAIDYAKVYPDQQVTRTQQDGAWVSGRREQRIAIVPTQTGDITLPEIRLEWWDTVTDRAQLALIPARPVTVLPAAEPPQPSLSVSTSAPTPALPDSAPSSALPPPSAPTITDTFWRWATLVLLGLWLVTLLAWRRERRLRPIDNQDKNNQSAALTLERARAALQNACHSQEPRAAAHAALQWAALRWPQQPPTHLVELAARLPAAEPALLALNRALYAPDPTAQWDGAKLWHALAHSTHQTASRPQPRPIALLPLYPQP